MSLGASVLLPTELDMSLAQVLEALGPQAERPLVLQYGGYQVQDGYHVTEVKAGSFVTLDCGGNPDAWQETVLQIEDIPLKEGSSAMSVGKFRAILAQVDKKVRLNDGARLTFEVGMPGVAMQVFDVAGIATDGAAAVIRLGARGAICKPRHRAQAEGCCSPGATAANKACCA